MHRIFEKIKSDTKECIPLNSKIALKSMINSSLLALLCSLIGYIILRNGIQTYSDIVVGDITLPGVYKNIDFYSYYIFLIVLIVSYLLFNVRYNRKISMKEEIYVELKPLHFVIGFLPAFLVILFRMNTIPRLDLCFVLFIAFIIVALKSYGMKNENVIKLALSCFFVYLSLSGIFALISYYSPNIADIGTKYFAPILFIILIIVGFLSFQITKGRLKKNEDIFIDIISIITQFSIPLCLFGLINTRYYYHGSQYIPVYYTKFNKLVIAFIIVLITVNLATTIYRIMTKKRTYSVSLSTIISFVSVSFWSAGYNLLINTDQFHTGETAIVYQQIVEIGQKWGSEFVSVLQGLGLTLSGLNELIFGGTYSTYTQSQNIFLVIIAIVTIVLLYFIVDHKWLVLLVAPVMPVFWMNRTYLIVPVFLFLSNPKIIKNPFVWSYSYILTCIIHVWYQATYGGAVAASLFPALFFIWYKAYKNTDVFDFRYKKNIIKIGTFVLSMVVIGILCIPMLKNAIHFMKTNGYETVIGNGISILQTITAEPTSLTGYRYLDMLIQFVYKFGSGLAYIIITIYMLTRYVIKQKDYIKQIQGLILTISTSISYILMTPAILTRIDSGISRIGAVGSIFFGFFVWILIYLYRRDIKIKPIAVLICSLSLSVCFYITYPPYLQIHQKANTIVNIPDNAIYVKPEETGLENLGYAFVMDEQYVHEAMIIDEISNLLLKENQTYYDLTDKSIYYLLTDQKVPGLYVSPLVTTNDILQNESIESIRNNDVPIVFINKPLNYIGVSPSLRSYRIYRYFMEGNYNFVRYKNCDFLVRNDIDLTPIEENIELLDLSNQIGSYDDIIDETSYNEWKLEELTNKNIIYMNSIEASDNKMYVNGGDPYIVFKSAYQIEFNNIQLIKIKLKDIPVSGMSGQLFVETDSVTHNEYNTIHFDIKSDTVLIPLYKYEQFNLDAKLVNLRLDFDNIVEGTDVTVESINLYALNEEQKENLAKQYNKLSELITDNRLDDIFHQSNLRNLPNQWGYSFENMKERFKASEFATSEHQEVQVTDSSKIVHYNLNKKIAGDEGEFLRIKLDFNDDKKRSATIAVRGIDKEGNDLYEEFQFVTVSGNMLIPIASSPNCIQAQELRGFDIIFHSNTEPYYVKMEEAQMYELIK